MQPISSKKFDDKMQTLQQEAGSCMNVGGSKADYKKFPLIPLN